MGLACLSALRSKDPSTQVGACIVNDENRVIGLGYNGGAKIFQMITFRGDLIKKIHG